MLALMSFGAGAYWNQVQAQGTPEHARILVDGLQQTPENESLGRQAMFRMHQDAWSTVDLFLRHEHSKGWRGQQARNFLAHWRERLRD